MIDWTKIRNRIPAPRSCLRGVSLCLLLMIPLTCMNVGEDGNTEAGEGEVNPDSVQYKMYGGKEPMYFTASNPGKWTGKDYEHIPVVQFYTKGKNKFLSVKMNLKQDTRHYIESILLLDKDHQEITSVPFERTATGKMHTDFYLGNERISSRYYVVAKCNKHDMWEQIVVLDETQTEPLGSVDQSVPR